MGEYSLVAADLYGRSINFSDNIPEALRYLCSVKANDFKELYYRPDSIIKSSVGEFYDKTMATFLSTVRTLLERQRRTTKDFFEKPFFDFNLALSVLPLSFFVVTEDAAQEGLLEGSEDPLLDEECLATATSEVGAKSEFYKDRLHAIEKAAYSICAGYAPQDVGRVRRIPTDSGFLKEYLVASVLYPWVMQSMTQLRLLVPSLSRELSDKVLLSYCNRASEKEGAKYPGMDLDTGYSLSYDILCDFPTYLELRSAPNSYSHRLRRQIWTPFMDFVCMSGFNDLPDVLQSSLLTCAQQSKKLYVEMLKTGLGYESQYATLCGYQGRCVFEGNFPAIVSLLDWVAHGSQSFRNIATEIQNDVTASFPFVKDSGLFLKK